MTGSVFEAEPRLPVVPPPWPGEGLGSWLAAIAAVYGMPLRGFLSDIGCSPPPHSDLADGLTIAPPATLLRALAPQLGVAVARMRSMSLADLDPGLKRLARAPSGGGCPSCDREASALAGRPVTLLTRQQPWSVGCARHPDDLAAPEIRNAATRRAVAVELDAVGRVLAQRLSGADAAPARQRFADFDPATYYAGGWRTGALWQTGRLAEHVLALAELLHAQVVLEPRSDIAAPGRAGIGLTVVARRPAASHAFEQRNSFALSLLAAWRMTDPIAGSGPAARQGAAAAAGVAHQRAEAAAILAETLTALTWPVSAASGPLTDVATALALRFREGVDTPEILGAGGVVELMRTALRALLEPALLGADALADVEAALAARSFRRGAAPSPRPDAQALARYSKAAWFMALRGAAMLRGAGPLPEPADGAALHNWGRRAARLARSAVHDRLRLQAISETMRPSAIAPCCAHRAQRAAARRFALATEIRAEAYRIFAPATPMMVNLVERRIGAQLAERLAAEGLGGAPAPVPRQTSADRR